MTKQLQARQNSAMRTFSHRMLAYTPMQREPGLFQLMVWSLVIGGCTTPSTRQLVPVQQLSNDPCSSSAAPSLYFAAPVCEFYAVAPNSSSPISAVLADNLGQTNPEVKVDFIAQALMDSRKKCQEFVNGFTEGQAKSNTRLDVLSLILSGLGAVLTPVETVRALSAASTAVQGTKQAINTDMFQQMTMLLLVQQINVAYYNKLSNTFSPASAPPFPPTTTQGESALSAAATLSVIEDIHKNCSVPFAAANISANAAKESSAGGAGTTGSSPPSWVVKISGTTTAGDVVKLTANSSAAGFTPGPSVQYKVGKTDNALSIATGLMNAIRNNEVLTHAGVTGTLPVQYGTTSAQLAVQGGPADISWSTNVSGSASESASASKSSTS